jgi:hypothetical protein
VEAKRAVPSLVQTEIEINASTSRVWSILTDFARYYEWNPFVTQAEGELRRGQELTLTLEPPDRHPLKIRPKVLDAPALGGVLLQCGRGDHQIALEPLPTGVRVSHVQRYEEVVEREEAELADRVRLGLQMMNAALKARAER